MKESKIFKVAINWSKSKIFEPIERHIGSPLNNWIIKPFIRFIVDPLSQLLSAFWCVLPYCWASVIALVLLFGLLWVMDQGQDVMVHLSGNFWTRASLSFFFGTLLLAFFNWYFPLKNIKKKFQDTTEDDFKFKRDLLFIVPRLMAVMTILISGYSMTLIAEKQNRITLWESSPLLADKLSYILVVVAILFFYYSNQWLERKVKNLLSTKKKHTLGLIILVLLSLVILPVTIGEKLNSNDHWLYFVTLSLSPFSLSILFYIVLSTSNVEHVGKKNMFYYFFNLLMILSFGVYIFSNLWIDFATEMGPAIVFICSLISLVVVFNSIVLNIIKYRSENKQITVLAVSFILIMLSFRGTDSKYRVKTFTSTEKNNLERIKASEYTDQWLNNVIDSCDTKMTIYLVASHGGGIRAAYWTNLVLAQYMDDSKGSFYDHVFSLSGASGGMVGEGLFTLKGKRKIKDSYVNDIVSLYEKGNWDFLSPIIAKLLGIDLVRSVWSGWPISEFPDRHSDLETLFLQGLDPQTKEIAEQDYLSFWKNPKKHVPLLISTSTWAQEGSIAIYSPVELDGAQQSHELDIYQRSDVILRANDEESTRQSVPFITAVLQSARFPVISPPGSLAQGYQFVDAGFRDNIGAGVTLDMLDLLINRMTIKELTDRFKIRILVINSAEQPEEEITRTSNSTLSSPIYSFMNLRKGYHSSLKESINEAIMRYREDSIDVSMIETGLKLPNKDVVEGKERKHIFPLGWYLSSSAGTTMQGLSNNVKLYDVDTIYGDLVKYYKGFMTHLDLDPKLVEFVRQGCSFELEHTILMDDQLRDIFKEVPNFRKSVKSLLSKEHAEQLINAAKSTTFRKDLIETSKRIEGEIEKNNLNADPQIIKAKKDIIKITAYSYFSQREGDKVVISSTQLTDLETAGDGGSVNEERSISDSQLDESHLSSLQTNYLEKTILPTQEKSKVIKKVTGVDTKITGFLKPERAKSTKSHVILEPAFKPKNNSKQESVAVLRDKQSNMVIQKPSKENIKSISEEKRVADTVALQRVNSVTRVPQAELIREHTLPSPQSPRPALQKTNEVYSSVEEMPKFWGCSDDKCTEEAVDKYIRKNLKIPKTRYFQKSAAQIEMSFVIDKKGRVTQIKRERSTTKCCEKETYTAIESMNELAKNVKWIPGRHQGIVVAVRYKVVIPLY